MTGSFKENFMRFLSSQIKQATVCRPNFFKNRITYIQLILIFINFNVRDFDLS